MVKRERENLPFCDTNIVKNRDNLVEHAHVLPHFVRRGVQGPAYGPSPPEAVDISSICVVYISGLHVIGVVIFVVEFANQASFVLE